MTSLQKQLKKWTAKYGLVIEPMKIQIKTYCAFCDTTFTHDGKTYTTQCPTCGEYAR